jgi:hypothetical protein
MKLLIRKITRPTFLGYLKPIDVTSESDTYPSVTFDHVINLSNNILNYKMVVGEDTILNLNLDLSTIKTPGNTSTLFSADQVLIGIADKVIDDIQALETVNTPYDVKYDQLVNMFNTTFLSKDIGENINYNGNKCPFKIFVPSKNSSVDEFIIIMAQDNVTPTITHTYSSDTLTLDISEQAKFKQIVSSINVTASKPTINADDYVTLTLTPSDTSITELYAEAVFGMITKTRIPVVNGVGTVKVSSLGLSSGDPVRIKFGYKYFTGVAEYTNTVT